MGPVSGILGTRTVRDGQINGRGWHVLARCRAPVGGRDLWAALLDKTEHPQRYSGHIRRAEVIDHDARTVVRRTWTADTAQPCIEYVRHEVRNRRVECSRPDQAFRRAQALVDTPEGRMLVYEVDDPVAARREGGVDAAYAAGVLQRILAQVTAPKPGAV